MVSIKVNNFQVSYMRSQNLTHRNLVLPQFGSYMVVLEQKIIYTYLKLMKTTTANNNARRLIVQPVQQIIVGSSTFSTPCGVVSLGSRCMQSPQLAILAHFPSKQKREAFSVKVKESDLYYLYSKKFFCVCIRMNDELLLNCS